MRADLSLYGESGELLAMVDLSETTGDIASAVARLFRAAWRMWTSQPAEPRYLSNEYEEMAHA